MKSIILASQSPRRKKLLRQIGLSFTVEPSTADETYDENESPEQIVRDLAMRKAKQVASGKDHSLVIGADTIVEFAGRILEKPADGDEAFTMLSSLSGNTHRVLTGVALVKTGKTENGNESAAITFCEETTVHFGLLDEQDIARYVDTGSPMDKAGAYGIQDDWGALFVERIEGDYNTVVGFPLFAFYRHMKSFAPEYLSLMNSVTDHA